MVRKWGGKVRAKSCNRCPILETKKVPLIKYSTLWDDNALRSGTIEFLALGIERINNEDALIVKA